MRNPIITGVVIVLLPILVACPPQKPVPPTPPLPPSLSPLPPQSPSAAVQSHTNQTATATLSIAVDASTPIPVPPLADNRYCNPGNISVFGAADGPATLPQQCFYTATDGTPASGAAIPVHAGDNLQSALNAAQCGQRLILDKGAVWTGVLTFPAKLCPDTSWVWVTTSGQLPPEGTRITPQSLSEFPNIQIRPGQSHNWKGADHYRFVGIMWTGATGAIINSPVGSLSGANHIIFDRNYIHGTPAQDFAHGIILNNARYIAVIDSWIDEMHCQSVSGACTDSQAVVGGNSTTPSSGIYKIVNNHLEAAAENIMFGGADPDPQLQIDTDIEVRRNYLYKPQRWNPKSPEYVAESPNPYNVKNCFELKSASRVLVEGNVCDGVWAGFSQKGRAVLLTTKNQPGSVDNVTIRYNLWQRIGGTWEIGNMTFPGYAYTLHDNLFAQVKWSYCYGGCGLYDSQITTDAGSTVNILHDISITHNTVAVDPAVEGMDGVENGTLTIDGPLGQKQSNLAINDNILVAGHYGLWPANGGCANSPSEKSPQGRIASCWSGWRMTGNIIAGGQSISGQLKLWPPGNSQPANQSAIGYTDLLGGDYSLSPDSPYRHTATDGTDPGADMDTLKALTWGVIDKM